MNSAVWWQSLVLAMFGGALGSGLRFAIGVALLQRFGSAFPWGTFAVNMIGAFIAGFSMVVLEARGPASWPWRALLIAGVIGGFTTFSALMMECLVFARTDRSAMIALYLSLTLAAGLLLVWLGARLALVYVRG